MGLTLPIRLLEAVCLICRSVKRIITRRPDERKRQQSGQGQLRGVSVLRETDGHSLLTGIRLRSICAQYAIPPRQVETEVRIGLPWNNGVMNSVHIGCDQHPAQEAVRRRTYANVAMVEH